MSWFSGSRGEGSAWITSRPPAGVAHDRGIGPGQGGIVMRPKDATCTFTLPDGSREVMDYNRLIAEGERLRAQVPAPKPRGWHYSFEFPSPLPGGSRR